jgi:hypothetical protein
LDAHSSGAVSRMRSGDLQAMPPRSRRDPRRFDTVAILV